jgi:mycothiol S-conjugate amidase
MPQFRLLACFAHPDDEAFSASGVLAASTARGVDARLVCATCGLVAEIRHFRPHVLLTYGPDGLSGHKDHITISRHTTVAFQQAGNPEAFTTQVQKGLQPYSPQRLFYAVRPRGYRIKQALTLRQAGVHVPLPDPELQDQGVPVEHLHVTLDVSAYLDKKIASMLCHRTQAPPDWPYLRVPRAVAVDLLGQEYLHCAYPPVPLGISFALFHP